MDDLISRADVEQTVEDNILCYTHSDRPIDQDPDTECHKAIRTALRMLRKDLRKLSPAQPEQRWIPCSERLPKKHGESYLVTISDGAVYTTALQWDANGKRWYLSFFNDGNILVDFIDDVIAWMPLPEPYKEGIDDYKNM